MISFTIYTFRPFKMLYNIVGQITTETGRKDLNLCGHYSILINLYATESGKIASCQHILTGLFF